MDLLNVVKNTETAPKYAPCRLFRKGDVVEPSSVNGRWSSPVWVDRAGIHYEVTNDEDPLTAHMYIKDPDSPEPFLVHAAFFKLVTPAEARFSFRVGDFPVDGEWSVWKDSIGKTEIISSYKIATHPNAKAAAEAERDRLNAEYRKEMGND